MVGYMVDDHNLKLDDIPDSGDAFHTADKDLTDFVSILLRPLFGLIVGDEPYTGIIYIVSDIFSRSST